MRSRVFTLIGAAGLSVAAATATTAPATAAAPRPATPHAAASSTPAPSDCARAVDDFYRGADGRRHTEAGPGRARVTSYGDGAGTRFDEVRPPAGWKPVSGTDAELEAFGFAPRPTGADALRDWERAFANYRGVEGAQPRAEQCADRSKQFATDYNDHWSGGLANGYTDYRRTYATVRWPQFTTRCGSRDENITGIWAGLGGRYSDELLQVGSYTRFDNDNGQAFWEALHNGSDSGVRNMELTIRNQDLLRPDVYYNSSNGTVRFSVYNQTTGFTTALVETSSINNYPASSFYDGSSAELIHERPMGGRFDGQAAPGGNITGGKFGLREWQDSGAGVSSAVVARAGQAAQYYGNLPHVSVAMTTDGAPSSPLLSYMYGGYQTSGSWTMEWNGCHG